MTSKQGVEFLNCRKVLASRRKELTKLGKGNKPNATRALTEDEVSYLYSVGYFGTTHPKSLLRTMWWVITKHFGHRGRDEARDMKFSGEYLEWDIERGTKTRTGEKPHGHQRQFDPKIFDKTAITIFKEVVSRRPLPTLMEKSPYYLAIKQNCKLSEQIWYLDRPLGKYSIGQFLADANKLLLLSL